MIQYIIMAHNKRKKYALDLQETLECPISWDNGDLGLVNAHVQAWEMASGDYTFVIQDDVILSTDFKDKVKYHVENGQNLYGECIFHLYLRNRPQFHDKLSKWKDRGHCLLGNLYSGNSIGIETSRVPEMLEHFKKMDVYSGDKRINNWIRSNNIPVYFPIPNLCEHRDLPSLHNGNSSDPEHRKSLYFEL